MTHEMIPMEGSKLEMENDNATTISIYLSI